jgi:hypothetical protein
MSPLSVRSNNVSYIVLVAINAELAGLLPTQKPGSVSKIPTVMAPPTVGVGGGVDVVSLQLVAPIIRPNVTTNFSFQLIGFLSM